MQHFSQYYFSKEDQHLARLTKPSAKTVRAATAAVDTCFIDQLNKALSENDKYERIGILLSGGVDSSLLLAMLRHHTKKEIVCFTALTENGDPDVLPSKEIAHIFNVKLVKCRITKRDLPDQLPPLLQLSRGGLYDTAANLALDSCMKYCQEEGISSLWTGNGLDMLFGGGVDPKQFKTNDKSKFHYLFWTFTLDLLINRFYEQTGDELNTLASRYGVNVVMPFENLDSIRCARCSGIP